MARLKTVTKGKRSLKSKARRYGQKLRRGKSGTSSLAFLRKRKK